MKKTMQTLLVLSLVVVMMFSLAACGGDKDADKATLTMATNAYFPPYEYYDGENIVGIDAGNRSGYRRQARHELGNCRYRVLTLSLADARYR